MSIIGDLMSFKSIKGFGGSIIRVVVDDASLYGEEVTLSKDGVTLQTKTVNDNGTVDFVTDVSGKVKVVMESYSLAVNFKITYYGTYNIGLFIHSESGVEPGAGDDSGSTDNYDTTTWAGIQKIIQDGVETEWLTVGDEAPLVTLDTGEVIQYQVGGIDLWETHQVIFVPKWCLGMARKMNSSSCKYSDSALYTWLNGDFYNSLPDDVLGVISNRTHYLADTSGSLYSVTEKIWLPTEFEIYNKAVCSYSIESSASKTARITIFANGTTRTLGKVGSKIAYWTCSVAKGYSGARFVNAGTIEGSPATMSNDVSYGILPCFEIHA